MLVSKIESIEEHQALEKDHSDVVNKQWGTKPEAIEGLIKTLLSQAQEKPSLAFVQNLGMGYRSGNNSELLERPLRNFSSGTELICFRCGESGHFQNNCEREGSIYKGGYCTQQGGKSMFTRWFVGTKYTYRSESS